MRWTALRARSRNTALTAALLAVLAIGGSGAPVTSAAADQAQAVSGAPTTLAVPGEVGLFPTTKPRRPVRRVTGKSTEVGLRFFANVPGTAVGARIYKSWPGAARTASRMALWDADGTRLATARVRQRRRTGWIGVVFERSVPLTPGVRYTVSAFIPSGRWGTTPGVFDAPVRNTYLTARRWSNGVFARRAGFPTRTAPGNAHYWVDIRFVPERPQAVQPSGWPGPDNTGVPAGTTLTRYTGPCTITSTRTLNAVDATNCDALLIRAPNVVITNSLTPRIDATAADDASVTITDSTVNAGNWTDGAIWGYNFTATRVEVTGGQHSVHCNDNCTLVDSWLHDQYNPDGESYHNNAFISNGGTNMLIRHNTLHCTAILNSTDGGCTADLSLFGDFDPITHVTVDANLFKANNSSISYCAYGGYSPSKPYPVAEYIVFTNNVFERGPNRRCGVYGPVTGFQSGATGNLWSGNTWDDGKPLRP